MEDNNKKKFWNAQIKSMIGPCMITFAIPLTIPGVTITVVAFSKDDVFTLYGFWHLLGLGFLAFSIILLILGCVLRIAWQPFIGPDLEMQLSPNPSFASIRNKVGDCVPPRGERRSIYTGTNMEEERFHSERIKPELKNQNEKQDKHNNRKNDKHSKIELTVHDKETLNLKNNTATNTNINLLQNASNQGPNKRQQENNSKDKNEITSSTEILKTNSSTTIMTPRQRTPRSLEPMDSSYSHGQDLFSVSKQALELDEIQKWRNRSKKKKMKATNTKSGNTEITTQCTKDSDSDSVAHSQSDTQEKLLSHSDSQSQQRRKKKRKKKKPKYYTSSIQQENIDGNRTHQPIEMDHQTPCSNPDSCDIHAEREDAILEGT